jgi:hypothetical protein
MHQEKVPYSFTEHDHKTLKMWNRCIFSSEFHTVVFTGVKETEGSIWMTSHDVRTHLYTYNVWVEEVGLKNVPEMHMK